MQLERATLYLVRITSGEAIQRSLIKDVLIGSVLIYTPQKLAKRSSRDRYTSHYS